MSSPRLEREMIKHLEQAVKRAKREQREIDEAAVRLVLTTIFKD